MSLDNLQIICSYCEKMFDPAKSTHRVRSGRKPYCSAECGKLGRAQQSITKKCLICEEDFIGNYQAKICSGNHSMDCSKCGKSFDFRARYKAKDISNKEFYCSFSCGRNSSPKTSITCILCSSDFIPKTAHSQVCSQEHLRKCFSCDGEFEAYPKYKPKKILGNKPLFCSDDCSFVSTSKYEEKIKDILDELVIPYERRNRKIISPLELDFYLPEHQIAIEVNDNFSHSKFKETEKFIYGGFKKGPNYHANKTRLCESSGIHLIHIWQDEILNKNELDHFRNMIKELCIKTRNDEKR